MSMRIFLDRTSEFVKGHWRGGPLSSMVAAMGIPTMNDKPGGSHCLLQPLPFSISSGINEPVLAHLL